MKESTITCRKCGKKFSATSDICPYCGDVYRLNGIMIFKFIFVALFSITCFFESVTYCIAEYVIGEGVLFGRLVFILSVLSLYYMLQGKYNILRILVLGVIFFIAMDCLNGSYFVELFGDGRYVFETKVTGMYYDYLFWFVFEFAGFCLYMIWVIAVKLGWVTPK